MNRIPVGVTISRASAEAAWKTACAEGRTVRPGDLAMTWDFRDDPTPAQERRFADFVTRRLPGTKREVNTYEALDGTC